MRTNDWLIIHTKKLNFDKTVTIGSVSDEHSSLSVITVQQTWNSKSKYLLYTQKCFPERAIDPFPLTYSSHKSASPWYSLGNIATICSFVLQQKWRRTSPCRETMHTMSFTKMNQFINKRLPSEYMRLPVIHCFSAEIHRWFLGCCYISYRAEFCCLIPHETFVLVFYSLRRFICYRQD